MGGWCSAGPWAAGVQPPHPNTPTSPHLPRHVGGVGGGHWGVAWTLAEGCGAVRNATPPQINMELSLGRGGGGRAVFENPQFVFVFWIRTAFKDCQLPTAANHQQPPLNRHPLSNPVSVVLCLARVLPMKQSASPVNVRFCWRYGRFIFVKDGPQNHEPPTATNRQPLFNNSVVLCLARVLPMKQRASPVNVRFCWRCNPPPPPH